MYEEEAVLEYMRIIVIGILYIIYMLFRCPAWLMGDRIPYLVRATSYSFFHGSILHLAINSLSIWYIWPGRDKKGDIRNFFTALVIAFLAYPFGFRPCIGFSNVLFAACGLKVKMKWLKSRSGIIFLALMLGMCFVPQFAGTNHIAAFIMGLALSVVNGWLQPLKEDVGRYTGNR